MAEHLSTQQRIEAMGPAKRAVVEAIIDRDAERLKALIANGTTRAQLEEALKIGSSESLYIHKHDDGDYRSSHDGDPKRDAVIALLLNQGLSFTHFVPFETNLGSLRLEGIADQALRDRLYDRAKSALLFKLAAAYSRIEEVAALLPNIDPDIVGKELMTASYRDNEAVVQALLTRDDIPTAALISSVGNALSLRYQLNIDLLLDYARKKPDAKSLLGSVIADMGASAQPGSIEMLLAEGADIPQEQYATLLRNRLYPSDPHSQTNQALIVRHIMTKDFAEGGAPNAKEHFQAFLDVIASTKTMEHGDKNDVQETKKLWLESMLPVVEELRAAYPDAENRLDAMARAVRTQLDALTIEK